MPEWPDVEVYCEAIKWDFGDQRLTSLRVLSPFVLRTVEPPAAEFEDKCLVDVQRIGKRVALRFEGGLAGVIHLMIAGRFQRRGVDVSLDGPSRKKKTDLVEWRFERASLWLTEAGSRKKASLSLVRGEDALRGLDPGGLEVFDCDLRAFKKRMGESNRTLKRALTDPRILSGIGNAYSDEILHAAKLSPFKQNPSASRAQSGKPSSKRFVRLSQRGVIDSEMRLKRSSPRR